jgi:hypothetical protein
MVGAVFVAIGVAAGIYLATHGGPRISMPDSIIGINRLDSPAAQQVVTAMRDAAKAHGWKGDAALYGYSQTQPSIVVLTVAARVSETSNQLMNEFAAGAASANNRFRLNLLASSQTTRDGATVICAPIVGRVRGAVCMWRDDHVLGFVAERDLSVDPVDLTAVVRTSVEH